MSDDTKVEIVITGTVDDSLSSSVAQIDAMMEELVSTTGEIGTRGGAGVEELAGVLSALFGRSAQADSGLESVTIHAAQIGKEGSAGPATLAEGLEKTSTGARTAESATSKLHLATAGAIKDYAELGQEVLSGDFNRLPQTLMSIATETGAVDAAIEALGSAFGPAGIAIAVVATALASLAAKEIEAAENAGHVKDAANFAGNFGISTEAIENFTKKMEDMPGVSSEAANQTAQAVASMAGTSEADFEGISGAIALYSQSANVSMESARNTIVRALSDPVANAGAFMRSLGGVRQDLISAADAAAYNGNANQAASLMIEAMTEKFRASIPEIADHNAGILQTISNYMAYIAQLQVGIPVEEAQKNVMRETTQVYSDMADAALKASKAEATEANTPQRAMKTGLAAGAGSGSDKNRLTDLLGDINKINQGLAAAKTVGDQVSLTRLRNDLEADKEAVTDLREKIALGDPDFKKWELAEETKTKASREGSAERIAIAQGEARRVKEQLEKENPKVDLGASTAYQAALQKVNEEKLAAATQGARAVKVVNNTAAEDAINTARDAANEIIANDKLTAAEKVAQAKAVWDKLVSGEKLTAQQIRQIKRDETNEESQIRKQAAAEQERLERDNVKTEIALAKEALAQKLAVADEEFAYMQITEAQRLAIQTAAIKQETRDEIAGLLDQQAEWPVMSAKWQELQNQIVLIQAAADTKLTQLAATAAEKTLQQWKDIISPIESAFTSLSNTLITQGGSFGKAVRQELLQVISAFVAARIKIEFDWLAGQAAMAFGTQDWANKSFLAWLTGTEKQTAATNVAQAEQTTTVSTAQTVQSSAVAAGVATQTATKAAGAEAGKTIEAAANSESIVGSAYKAAAGAYSALAGIPIIGPVLGAAAAAITFAAVMAYDVISSEGGAERVGADGQIAILHKNETVLPARIAMPLMALVSSNAAMANVGEAAQADTIRVPAGLLSEIRSAQANGTTQNSAALAAGSVARTVPVSPSGPISSGSADIANRSEAPGGFFGAAIRDMADVIRRPGPLQGTASPTRGGDTYVIQALDTSDFRAFLSKSANRRAMADIARDRHRAGERV